MEEKIINVEGSKKYCNSLLASTIVEKYDYIKTRQNVIELLNNYIQLKYKFINLPSPKITPDYQYRYECYTRKRIDRVGKYVERKFDTDYEVQSLYSEITDVIEGLTTEEQIYYIESLISNKTEEYIAEKLKLSRTGLNPIKQSCVIKFALAFGIEEYAK